MATDKELKAVLGPVLECFPDWRYARHWLFSLPIGYYVRGIALKASWSDREVFEIWRCVYPTFESSSSHGMHIGWGQSLAIPGSLNHGWNVFHPGFADSLIEVMEQVVVPQTAHIEKGSDFLSYLTNNYTSHGWQNWGKALAHIHMGDLETARDLLIPDACTIRTRFPQLQTPDAWSYNLLELLRLIEEDPAAIPAHCEGVAQKTVAINKIEKFWKPTPFVYEHSRS